MGNKSFRCFQTPKLILNASAFKMKVCIFGGGPTGMRLADELSKKGYEIELHEADGRLGGCWRVDWLDGYYREHAPKVMTEKYYKTMKLLQSLGAKTKEIEMKENLAKIILRHHW